MRISGGWEMAVTDLRTASVQEEDQADAQGRKSQPDHPREDTPHSNHLRASIWHFRSKYSRKAYKALALH